MSFLYKYRECHHKTYSLEMFQIIPQMQRYVNKVIDPNFALYHDQILPRVIMLFGAGFFWQCHQMTQMIIDE